MFKLDPPVDTSEIIDRGQSAGLGLRETGNTGFGDCGIGGGVGVGVSGGG